MQAEALPAQKLGVKRERKLAEPDQHRLLVGAGRSVAALFCFGKLISASPRSLRESPLSEFPVTMLQRRVFGSPTRTRLQAAVTPALPERPRSTGAHFNIY